MAVNRPPPRGPARLFHPPLSAHALPPPARGHPPPLRVPVLAVVLELRDGSDRHPWRRRRRLARGAAARALHAASSRGFRSGARAARASAMPDRGLSISQSLSPSLPFVMDKKNTTIGV